MQNSRLIRNTDFIRNFKGGMTYDSIKTECNNGTGKDTNSERKEAFARLEQLRKKGTVTDDDAELASYREDKYGR